MPSSPLLRHLDATESAIVRLEISRAVDHIIKELDRRGCDNRAYPLEIGMALARAACRFDFDLLEGAAAKIDKLEAVVAEMGAALERAKIGAQRGGVDPFVMREAIASAELAGAKNVGCRHPIGHRERGDEFNPDRCGLCHVALP